MKRIIAIILSCMLVLTGCGTMNSSNISTDNNGTKNTQQLVFDEIEQDVKVEFENLNDPELLQYVEDKIYADLVYNFDSEDYIIEDVSAAYISKEYLEELEYNSKENIYFGYTLADIDTQFDGTRYVFTLGKDGNTVVQKFEEYDDTYNQIIKNVAIGTGVILVCVTVSVVSGGLGAPGSVSTIFTASAKSGAAFALSSGLFSGVTTGVVSQIQTGDFEESLKTASLSASEGFKWGAITGVITGGVGKALKLHKSVKTIPTARESEKRAAQIYSGRVQVSYLNGKEVPMSTKNATRPDVVRCHKGVLEAIEVKNYNLESKASCSALCQELKRQVQNRVINLPAGSKQRVVLDVKGRDFSDDLIQMVIKRIRESCADIYPNLPVDILY